MDWIEIPLMKSQLSEIDTKGVLINLSEVSSAGNCDSPSVLKTARGKCKGQWESSPAAREHVVVQCTKKSEVWSSSRRGKNVGLQSGRCTVHQEQLRWPAQGCMWYRAARRRWSSASSLRTDFILLLTWFGSGVFKIRFCFLLTRWPLLLMRHFWG